MIRYKFGIKIWPNLSVPEMEVACIFETPASTYMTTQCSNHKEYNLKSSDFQTIQSLLNLARLTRVFHAVLLPQSA